MRALSVAAALLIAGPAFAQDYNQPEIVRGLCQKDGCDEFSVVRVDRIRANEEGTLVQTRIRTFHASSQGRVERGEDTGFVFYSPTKPTILAQSQGKVAGFQIATAPTQESRETIRQQANFYAMYFTICHGLEAGRAAVHNLLGVAQQYGYRSPLAKSVMVKFTSPEEVFSRPPTGAGGQAQTRLAPQPPQPDLRAGDSVPRANPDPRDRPLPSQRVAERREERVVERRVLGEDEEVVIVKKRRTASDETPWYQEPQRWIEKLNPF